MNFQMTNLPIIVLPLLNAMMLRRYIKEVNHWLIVPQLLLTFNGLASTYYHATLNLFGQLVDELSLVWIINMFLVVYIPVMKWFPKKFSERLWVILGLRYSVGGRPGRFLFFPLRFGSQLRARLWGGWFLKSMALQSVSTVQQPYFSNLNHQKTAEFGQHILNHGTWPLQTIASSRLEATINSIINRNRKTAGLLGKCFR